MKHRLTPSASFIGLFAQLDTRYATVFATYRNITDYFFTEPGAGNIVEQIASRVNKIQNQAVADKLAEIQKLVGIQQGSLRAAATPSEGEDSDA